MSTEHDNSLHYMLGEIKAMLAGVVTSQDTLKQDIKDLELHTQSRANSHSDRITKLEQSYWKQVGVISAISFVPIALTIWAAMKG